MTTHFDTLGVSPDASSAEIANAYRDLARVLHPDTQPDASPAQRAKFTTMMAEVNEAWAVLKDEHRRAEYRASIERPAYDAPMVRHPAADECLVCGSFPAIAVRFRHQKAWLIGATVHETELQACHGCGTSLGRSAQNRTLWLGWWGVFSFLRNFAYIATNAKSLYRLNKLSVPRRRNEAILTPLITPLPRGRPVLMRAGALVTVGFLAVLIGVVAAGSEPETATNGPPRGTSSDSGDSSFATWEVGSCVSGYSSVVPVPCSSMHSGRIVASTFSGPEECPISTESYVVDGARVWCIDDDR